MKFAALVFSSLLYTTAALAQDHLTPEIPAGANGQVAFVGVYPANLADLLPDAYADNMIARVTVVPAFFPPFAVGLTRTGNRFGIVTAQAPRQRDAALPSVSKSSCRIDISAGMGRKIANAWLSVLLQTRYSERPRIGADGAIYHFWFREPSEVFVGQIWNPSEKSTTGKLVAITQTMSNLCEKHDGNSIVKLNSQLNDLSGALIPNKMP